MWAVLLALSLGANPWLDEGSRHFDALRYPEAAAALRTALDVPTSTLAERRRAGELLARALLAQGKNDEAEAAWSALLVSDPAFPDPTGVAPKVKDAFTRAKEKVYPRGYVKLALAPSATGQLAVAVTDPWRGVRRVELVDGEKRTALVLADGVARGTLEASELSRQVQALDDAGSVLSLLEVPKVVITRSPILSINAPEIEAGPTGPPRWPAWTSAAVAAASLGTALALGLSAGRDFDASRAAPDALTARQLDGQSRSKAVGANVLVAVGAAAGAGAVALFVWSW